MLAYFFHPWASNWQNWKRDFRNARKRYRVDRVSNWRNWKRDFRNARKRYRVDRASNWRNWKRDFRNARKRYRVHIVLERVLELNSERFCIVYFVILSYKSTNWRADPVVIINRSWRGCRTATGSWVTCGSPNQDRMYTFNGGYQVLSNTLINLDPVSCYYGTHKVHSTCVSHCNIFLLQLYRIPNTSRYSKNMPGHGGNRTYDLWNTNPMLCQLSYAVRSVRVCDISELSL